MGGTNRQRRPGRTWRERIYSTVRIWNLGRSAYPLPCPALPCSGAYAMHSRYWVLEPIPEPCAAPAISGRGAFLRRFRDRFLVSASMLACSLVAQAELPKPSSMPLRLEVRTQVLQQDAAGRNVWQVESKQQVLDARQTAIIVCDMWDKHWSRGASERVEEMVSRMNDVLKKGALAGLRSFIAPRTRWLSTASLRHGSG